MTRAAPGSLGSFSPLDEDPLLFAEWECYAAAHARHEAAEAARQKSGRGGGHSRRLAGHPR